MDLKAYEHLVRNESATRKFLMWMIFFYQPFLSLPFFIVLLFWR